MAAVSDVANGVRGVRLGKLAWAAAGTKRFADQVLKSEPSTPPLPLKSPCSHSFVQVANLLSFQRLKSEPPTELGKLGSTLGSWGQFLTPEALLW